MPSYTTGELAKLCGVSVRTVQFYDGKGLLPPSALTEGGRRLYSQEDCDRLQLICMLKTLGLSLGEVKGILDSDHPERVLMLLLQEQEKRVTGELQEKQGQLEAIRTLRETIRQTNRIPVNSIDGLEHAMENKGKLKRTYTTMLLVGILMDLIEIGTVVLWVTRGIWWPFAVGMPLVVLAAVLLVRLYYRNTEYICPECHAQFKPALGTFFFALHTMRTRKLRCPSCGHKGYCVEVASPGK